MADWYFRNNQNQGQQQHGNLMSCPGCRNLVRRDEEFCPYCARRLRPESGARAWIRKMLAQPFIATRGLIGLCVFMLVVQLVFDLILPGGSTRTKLFDIGTGKGLSYVLLGSNIPPLVAKHHQYWRFVTACFLHFGFLHIILNCYAFWTLGRLAERVWGGRQVFATFVLTGITGSFGSFIWNSTRGIGVNSAGASGAICGILGLFLGAYYKDKRQIGDFLGSQLIYWAACIIVFGLVMRVADNAAHIGGMLGGAALGYFLPPTNVSRNLARDTKVWKIASHVAAGCLIVGFGFMTAFCIENIPAILSTM